jgi:adenylate cyclase
VDLSLLFVDVRGSTNLAQRMTATEFSRLMNRFYAVATDVLVKTNAFIDKLVGDEVIGIYLPIFTGANHARPATDAAMELLRATGHGGRESPWLPVGVGVHTGKAFFGTVSGADGVFSDFTALGDTVNTTARVASAAQAGEALITEAAYAAAGRHLGNLEQRTLRLKGKSEPVTVRVAQIPSD